MQVASLSAWYKSLAIPLLITGLALAAFVAVFSLTAGAIILALVACVILYSANLSVAVPFMLLLLPFDFHRQINGVWIYFGYVLVALALPLARLPLRIPKAVWLFIPYLVFVMLSGFWRSLNPTWFWGHIIRWMIGLILAYAIYSLRGRESAIIALGATLVPLCIYGAYQLAIGDFGALWTWMFPHRETVEWIPRARSFLTRPNEYGYFCVVITSMLLALAVRGYRRNLCLILSTTGVIGLILSGSRGAMIGLAVALLILVLESKIFLRTVSVALSVALFVWMFSLFPTQLLDRSDEPLTTPEGRMMVWAGAYAAFTQHPWIGIGSMNLSTMMHDFVDVERMPAHNAYLQILAETGIVGFILFFGPLAYLLRSAWKRKADRAVWAGLLALSVFCVHGLFDNLMVTGESACVLLFFCALGLVSLNSQSNNPNTFVPQSKAGQK